MKQIISYIFTFFSTVIVYGQVTLAVSEVKDQKINQRFNLTVLLEISGENMEQQTPLQMPDFSKFDIIGSASERNTIVVDASKGNVVNQLVYQYVLAPKQAGKIKIGSVLVTVNDKIYKTEPFDITVRENEKAASVADNSDKNDLYLNLELQDKEVFKNEPTLAYLRAYSKNYDNFRKVGKIQWSPQNNANIKAVSYAKSEIETKSGVPSQVIGVFMVSPSESGTININPISASLNQTKVTSNKARLTVRNLPEGMPLHFKNAVGNFTLEALHKNTEEISEVDKPLNIILQVVGSGNLNGLHLPKLLNSEHFIFYPPKITTSTSAKNNGLSGITSAEYVIVPKKSGLLKLNFEDFSFFNPQLRKYVNLGAKELILNVKTPEQIADAKTTLEKVNDYTNTVLETVNTPVLQTHALKVKNRSGINWKIVLGNVALLTVIITAFLFVLRKKEKKKLKTQLLPKPIMTIADTEKILRESLRNHYEESIEYLKKVKDSKDFATFFSTYEELNSDTQKQFKANNDSEFRAILEKEKGQHISEKYRILSEQIQIEKFAPFHFNEQMDELYEHIVTFYSEINK
jgi:hypothetical protein